MHLYGFVLGRKYLLSLAELLHVFPPRTPIIELQPNILVAALPVPLDKPQQVLDRLGGTQQIIEIVEEFSQDKVSGLAESLIQQLLKSFNSSADEIGQETKPARLLYSLSSFSIATGSKENLKNLLTKTKKIFGSKNTPSRYVNNNFENPHAAVLAKEKLIKKGTAMAIIEGKFKTFVGKIVAIQDFEDYSYRDYNRPARDAKLGMLPPKLAQIMLNLSGLTTLYDSVEKMKNLTVFDPFAGIGTVLTEGLRMGYSVIGSDLKADVLLKAEKNIAWTRERYFTKGQNSRLFIHDATTLTREEFFENIAAIVTETYLGPPLSKLPPLNILQKNLRSLEELLLRFLRVASSLLSSGSPLVLTTPVYRLPEKFIHLDALPQLAQKYGFQLSQIIPKKIRQNSPHLFTSDYRECSLLYDREDQLVGREIWRLVKS